MEENDKQKPNVEPVNEDEKFPAAEGPAAPSRKKKNKKKKKSSAAQSSETATLQPNSQTVAEARAAPGQTQQQAAPAPIKVRSEDDRARLALALQLLQLKEANENKAGPVHTREEAMKLTHKFWDTQPMLPLREPAQEAGPLHPAIPIEDVQPDPYPLPASYVWSSVDILDEKQLDDVYNLLAENYVEDDENMFRFAYSKEFLKWALLPPGWRAQWHIGVRAATSGVLVGFISAVPATLRVHGNSFKAVEVNYLCVHKKLRTKRLAPVLIQEVTRRVHLEGIFQATYTAGAYLPTPVCSARYYHRSLHPKKLIDVGFSYLPHKQTLQQVIKRYRLPESPQTKGLRPMEEKDVEQAWHLLDEYLKKFLLSPYFDKEEFTHWFLPKEGIVSTYVVEDAQTGAITDMISFYTVASTIINHSRYNELKAAYAFYNVSKGTSFENLMYDALILAKQTQHDVYNCLDLMDNASVLETFKFGVGDGRLQYYLYNYGCPEMKPEQLGLVLL